MGALASVKHSGQEQTVRRLLATVTMAALGGLAPCSAVAQNDGAGTGQGAAPRSGAVPGRPTVTAVRAAQAPMIDGRLDDPVWRAAALIDKFVQERPVEGGPATEQTEVRVAYDSEKLYVGIYAHYSDPSLIRANRSDRDKTDDDDTVTVFLEPFLDYLRGYSFSVNGYGVQRDAIIVVTNSMDDPAGDPSWNALYYSAALRVEDGWTAEMAIPIKSLRYPSVGDGQAHRWGFQIRRQVKGKDELDVWSPVSRNTTAFLPQIGILGGLTNLSTAHNFELLPTFTATQSGSLNSATGRFVSDDAEKGGFGVKYGISSNLTLDFTYNPDFSNIESDTQQVEVNQRFPVNYPELRPFFLEGQEIYQIPGTVQPVQTRTIVNPRYGAKLTGKIGKRTSVGMFLADDQAPGQVDDPANPAFGKSAQNVLGRVKFDLYRNAHIGAIFTDREFLNGYSRLIGVDSTLRFGNLHSCTVRLYRSDRMDLSGTGQVGGSLDNSCRRISRNFNWTFQQFETSPDFGNQLSFIRRVDQIANQGTIFYRWWPEGRVISWGPQVNHTRLYSFDRVLQNTDTGGQFDVTFAKNITFSTNVHRLMERYREINFEKTQYAFSGTINTNRKILFTGSVSNGDEIRFVVNPWLGPSRSYSATVTVRPIARLQSVVKLNTTRLIDPRTETAAIDVTILRLQATYQFTSRLLIRNITELNRGIESNHTLFQNILVTYRVNSGTVFYVGYDARHKDGDAINPKLFQESDYQRTGRAFFLKLQYLYRSGTNN